MSTLDRALRRKLSDTIIAARQVAEEAAADAVRRLGIIEDEAPTYLTPEQKVLRVRLRAHARTLGDGWNAERKKLLTTKQLENEATYEIWHRMLFGRFLVERGLLIHPDLGVPVAASELADLAQEAGESDPWALVERFAAPSLPAVFKPNDPTLAMTLDPALAKRLRDLVARLPVEVFSADDSLGWSYQFWRIAEKDAINAAGVKIGAAELPAVTQLFTEPYMVKFLLHNTLGAWWAGRVLAADPTLARNAADEQTLRDACTLPGVEWEYLRFVRDRDEGPWHPAAGSFPSWPSKAAEITFCDPCCGSGHFLVEVLTILATLRQVEDRLSEIEATQAVLRDNLHGLEIDGRCVQIAAFNVALVAWRIAGGPVALPQPRIAWVGAPPPLSRLEMANLANGDLALRNALQRLYDEFQLAPLLGSLIDVGVTRLLDVDLRSHGDIALRRLVETEPEHAEGIIAARGLFEAANLLGQKYVLVATNVPFLGSGRQVPALVNFIASQMPDVGGELATAMLDRMMRMVAAGGAVASVTPQNWLTLHTFKDLRQRVLSSISLSMVVGLGTRAFETITGAVVNASLVVCSGNPPSSDHDFVTMDAAGAPDIRGKKQCLNFGTLMVWPQSQQIKNPDCRIALRGIAGGKSLAQLVDVFEGFSRGDTERFDRKFWELPEIDGRWKRLCASGGTSEPFSGRSTVFLWENGKGSLSQMPDAGKGFRGMKAWGVDAIFIERTGQLKARLTNGEAHAQNCVVLVPKKKEDLEWLYRYFVSHGYRLELKKFADKLILPTSVYITGNVDEAKWKNGPASDSTEPLPEPYSDDPTQWIFHGHPAFAEGGTELHVALARVAGYVWPAEQNSKMRLSDVARQRLLLTSQLPDAASDGLLPLHAVSGHAPLADRIRSLLSVAYGAPCSPAAEARLIRAADMKIDRKEGRNLTIEGWLRDRAFRQHCSLFHNRPFLWHVWDGLPDGFSAFMLYHRLGYSTLEKLTYTILGDWIAQARADGTTAHEDRALQLQQRLGAILDGDAPFDIFIRWKPLIQQPIGWNPDLDDGVRQNMRPFVTAQILRGQPRLSWTKDRGSDPISGPWYHLGPRYGCSEGDRINDHHLTLAERQAAHASATAL